MQEKTRAMLEEIFKNENEDDLLFVARHVRVQHGDHQDFNIEVSTTIPAEDITRFLLYLATIDRKDAEYIKIYSQ